MTRRIKKARNVLNYNGIVRRTAKLVQRLDIVERQI